MSKKQKKESLSLDVYEYIAVIECLDEESFGRLMVNFSQKKFEGYPRETVGHALIIPESFIGWLDFYSVRHRIVKLIHVSRLREEVLYVIDKKYRHSTQPNYYMFELTVAKNFVELAVAEQIQEKLNSGEIKLDLEQKMVSVYDIGKNINALVALAGENITCEEWEEILKSEQVIGKETLKRLHDFLLEHGEEIDTAGKLRELIQRLKNKN